MGVHRQSRNSKIELMKRNYLKKYLIQKKLIFCGWTSLGHVQNSEAILSSNIDCLGIDIEHSTISQEQALNIISVCNLKGKSCLPRVASHNSESIRRLLDSGADGVIIPNVESYKDIENIISWVKYPKIGNRGYGIARAHDYGHNFNEYVNKWNKDSIIIIQIESINAVNNLPSIIDNKHIDGVIVGPYDISGSLGIPGKINDERVIAASKKVLKVCNKFNKSCGIHLPSVSASSLNKVISDGFNFIILASDIFILRDWATEVNKTTNKWLSKRKI